MNKRNLNRGGKYAKAPYLSRPQRHDTAIAGSRRRHVTVPARTFRQPIERSCFRHTNHEAVEHARSQVAALIGAAPEEIVFTSGGTEANNLAIIGATDMLPQKKHIVSSVIEHPATAEPCRLLERRGWNITWLPVDETGRIRPGDVDKAVDEHTAIVSIMHANNETGSLQPIAESVLAAHSVGALFHTDAAQSVGKVSVRVDDLGVDFLSIAGHKLYAPKGVGALFVRAKTDLKPVLRGAGHERGLRPGTENVASIVGLGVACEIAGRTLAEEGTRLRQLRDLLWNTIHEAVPNAAINGHPVERLPNTLNVRFPGVLGNAVLALAPGIAASTGSACHESGESPSTILTAMGLEVDAALGSVRLSLGRGTTEEDIRLCCTALVQAWTLASSRAGS